MDARSALGPADRRLRVAIAEDSTLFRDGLRMLLEAAGHEVVDAVGSGPAMVDVVDRVALDAAVMDIRMPPEPLSGMTAARTIRSRHPGVGLLLLSNHVEIEYVRELLTIGTRSIGYRVKDEVADVDELSSTLLRIVAGELVIEPSLAAQLGAPVNRDAPDGLTTLATLTDRELDVLRLLAEGRSNSGVAEVLFISVKSVERHIAAIFAKLGLPADVAANHRRVMAVLAYLRAANG